MRTHIRHAAVALALSAAAGAANAQTVITREVTNEPVETIIERGPNGTVITRRPLDTTSPRPSVTLPAGAATETVETVETARVPTTVRETTGSATTLRGTSDVVAPRRAIAPPAAQKQRSVRKAAPAIRNAPTRAVRSTTGTAPTRTVVRTAPVADVAPAPILTTAQRSTIYRTIVEERVVPRTVVTERSVLPFPFGPPPVVVDPALREEAVTERVVTTPPIVRERIEPAPRVIETVGSAPAPAVTQRVVTTPASVDLMVGSRVPTTVPLYALPHGVGLQIPAVRSYRYAIVDDRVFLVDPATGLIVEELAQ